MKKNSIILIFIVSILTTIIVIGAFVFFIHIIKNKNQHASAVAITLAAKMKEKDNSIIYAEKVAEIKSIQSSINNYFVDSNKIDIFVDYLEKIGLNFGSDVVVKSIEIPAKTKSLILFKVLITGNFDQTMKTLNYLEHIPYQINITQASLNIDTTSVGTDQTNMTPRWAANLSFTVLSLN